MRRSFFVSMSLLLVLLMLNPGSAAGGTQSISCRSASYLTSRSVTGSYSTCYTFTVPDNSSLLQIELVSTSGATDLYVREGRVLSLGAYDKVTASATSGEVVYVLLNPSATTYTIAAVPSSTRGSFRLTASTTTSTARDQPSLSCSQNSCTASFTLGSSIKLGSSYGDQLIFPVVIGSTGRVSARASWSGTASNLALELYGPSLYSANPTTSYVAISGRSPQSLSYNVTSSDLQRSANWQVTLVNDNRAGGSIRSGSLVITYPPKPPTLYLAPIRGYYYVAPK